MKSKQGEPRILRTYINVSLVFLILAASLQVLIWFYWGRVLEPRLRREAKSQADVLAHSQAVKLADVLTMEETGHRLEDLRETVDEILLFTGPASDAPLFLGLDLEIDYDAVSAPRLSLDGTYGVPQCLDCFLSEVALYSPHSDELIGIARFRVSDRLFRRLRRDVQKTLFTQSRVGIILLLLVWGVVIFLIRELNRSRYQAEAASRAKSAFLANMSHELRTPLNAIIGFSEMMRNDPVLASRHRQSLSIINRSGEYLLELINDVLELSKIEAARVSLQQVSFDLYDTLEKVTEMIRLRAEKKNLQLLFERSADVPRYIKTDERKLRQILLNLLGNAVKFTEQGGVALRVGLRNDGGAAAGGLLTIRFEVEDSGPGIAPEEQAMMFEAFSQTRSGYDKKEGTGLGLTISRQFVRHLGGEIGVRSQVGKGTVFEFTVRVRPATSSEVGARRPERRIIGVRPRREGATDWPCRILVVDDNVENRTLLQMLLEQIGFSVRYAENGLWAVELAETWKPHLIWMDMRMPVMDGYEATRTIHRKMKERPVIIALTASAFKEDRDKGLAAGCDDFVRRPFREAEIFDKMHEYLDIEYIYEPCSPSPDPNQPVALASAEEMRRALARLPGKVLEELHAAIELSDMDRMDRLVADIGAQHGPLGRALKNLIDTFQYDRILALFDRVAEGTDGSPGDAQ